MSKGLTITSLIKVTEKESCQKRALADYQRFLWRDLCIVCITLSLWWSNAQQELTGASAVLCGILTGICAMQLHEWGHLWGAFRSHADIYAPRHWWHPFMFSLDHTTNTREQFIALSIPAFIATILYISAFWIVMPSEQLAGQTALTMSSITASLTLLIEVPLFIRVYCGGSLPAVELFSRHD